LVNPEEVGDCFIEDFIGTMPSGEQHCHLADYLMRNCIGGCKRPPESLFTHTYRNTFTILTLTPIYLQLI
jgi:hypothetical protein